MHFIYYLLVIDYIFAKCNHHGLIEYILYMYENYKEYSEGIDTLEHNVTSIIKIKRFCKLCLLIIIHNIRQYFCNTKNKRLNKYEVSYTYKNKIYRVIFNSSILSDTNIFTVKGKYNNIDYTDVFMEYLGPNYDFHNKKYTLKDMNINEPVIIDYENGPCKIINLKEVINILQL